MAKFTFEDVAALADNQDNPSFTFEDVKKTAEKDISAPEKIGLGAIGVAGGVGQGFFELGSTITSLGGLAPNPVSEFLGKQAEAVSTEGAKIGIPEGAIQTGNIASSVLPVGGVIGGVMALLGKTSILANRVGKVSRAIRTTLTEAAKDPAKAVAIEAAITSGGAGAGKGVEELTDSPVAGLATEFATGSFLGTKAAKLAYGLSVAKEDGVSSVLAERLRKDPELLARANQNAAEIAKEGLKIRLDLIMKDPSVVATMRRLETHGGQAARDRIAGLADENAAALEATADALADGSLTPQEAEDIIDGIRNRFQSRLNDAISSLDSIQNASTRESVGKDMFDLLSRVKDAAEKEAIRLYSMAAGNTTLPDVARKIIMASLKKAASTDAKDKAFILRLVQPAIRAVKKELGAVSKGKKPKLDPVSLRLGTAVKPRPLSAKGINEVRGAILGMARTLVKSPDGRQAAARLFQLVDGLTKALDLVPNVQLKAANKLWREIRKVFDRSDISFFFKENADGLINSPEQFVKKFLTGPRSTKAIDDLIDFANSAIAKANGLDMAAIRDFARKGFLADIRASVDRASELTSVQVGKYVARHRELLDRLGLLPEFMKFGNIARLAKRLNLELSSLDRLTLNKFGIGENPNVLRNSLNSGAYKVQMARLPTSVRPAFKRTLLNAAIRDNNGNLLPPDKIVQVIARHKDLANGDEHLKRISRIARIMQVPQPGKTFDDFERFFAKVDIGEKIKSVLLERITRPLLKAARIGTNTRAFFLDRTAQDKMIDYMFTDEGARIILDLASKNRQSKAFIRALALARTSATEGEQNGP